MKIKADRTKELEFEPIEVKFICENPDELFAFNRMISIYLEGFRQNHNVSCGHNTAETALYDSMNIFQSRYADKRNFPIELTFNL